MAKSKRGRSIKGTKGWRGTCPLCSRTGVKLLWDKVVESNKVKVCKVCGK